MFKTKRPMSLLILLVVGVASVNCRSAALQPSLPQVNSHPPPRDGKPPIIFIPGILGSRLVNRRTGESIWPDKKGDDLALPISSPVLAENRDDLVATEVLEATRVNPFLPKVDVYGPLLENLEFYGGYRHGNIAAPPPWGYADTVYTFAYDWRRDIVESAQALGCAIEELKLRLGRPDLRFDIVAHSMGGLVARYYAMYGERDVLYDPFHCPDWAGARNLGRIIMIGAPNAGSMYALSVLLRGYSASDTTRRSSGFLFKIKRELDPTRVGPHDAFTAPSLYQLLPAREQARFFDGKLNPTPVELYEVETWRAHKWSAAFDPKIRQRELRRLSKELGPIVGKTESLRRHDERERFLPVTLRRAAAFQNALAAPSPPPASLRFVFIGGDCIGTLDGAVILKGIAQRTIFKPSHFPGETRRRRKVADLIFSPGDGLVTRRSLLGYSLNAQPAIPVAMRSTHVETAFFCRSHNGLVMDTAARNNLLTALLARQ
jgi:pimeloyl-ACP methyl ester carboxylesterase